jgi:hypothetical protein
MKKLILIIATLFTSAILSAQVNLGANFVFAFPNGNFGDIASPAVGGGIEANFFLSKNFVLGIEVQYTDFGKNNKAIFDVDIEIIPVIIKAEYYLTESELRPFVGLGLGYYFVNGDINLGNSGNGLNFTIPGFGVSPRFGLIYDFSKNSGLALNMQYNVVFGQEYESDAIKDLLDPFKETNYFSILLGYRFTFNGKTSE